MVTVQRESSIASRIDSESSVELRSGVTFQLAVVSITMRGNESVEVKYVLVSTCFCGSALGARTRRQTTTQEP